MKLTPGHSLWKKRKAVGIRAFIGDITVGTGYILSLQSAQPVAAAFMLSPLSNGERRSGG